MIYKSFIISNSFDFFCNVWVVNPDLLTFKWKQILTQNIHWGFNRVFRAQVKDLVEQIQGLKQENEEN